MTICNYREVTLWSDGWYFNSWSVRQPLNKRTQSRLGPQPIRTQMRSWSGVLPNVNSHGVEMGSHVYTIKHTCSLSVAMDSQVLGWWTTAGLVRRTCGPRGRKGQRSHAMKRPHHSQLSMKLPRQKAWDERGTNTVSSVPPTSWVFLPCRMMSPWKDGNCSSLQMASHVPEVHLYTGRLRVPKSNE